MSATHLVDSHIKLSPSILSLKFTTVKLDKILRWDPKEQDEFTDTLALFHAAGNKIVPEAIPNHIEAFIDRYLNGFIANTRIGHIALSLGKGDLKSQWEAYDKRAYKKANTIYFGPRGMLLSCRPTQARARLSCFVWHANPIHQQHCQPHQHG